MTPSTALLLAVGLGAAGTLAPFVLPKKHAATLAVITLLAIIALLVYVLAYTPQAIPILPTQHG